MTLYGIRGCVRSGQIAHPFELRGRLPMCQVGQLGPPSDSIHLRARSVEVSEIPRCWERLTRRVRHARMGMLQWLV